MTKSRHWKIYVIFVFAVWLAGTAAAEIFLENHVYREESFTAFGQMDLYVLPAVVLGTGCLLLLGGFGILEMGKKKRIEELTQYLEQVNIKGTGIMAGRREDEFSILQDEIYKTVTSLYQTREQAMKAKRNYADNLVNIAHQLKTPLTAASMSVQLFKESGSFSYIDKIQKQINRLTVLEEALLKIFRIDSGTLELDSAPVDIYTALNLAADSLEELAEEKRVKINILENGCVEFTGDMEWTVEALMNLMKNCIEHTPENKAVYCEYSWNPLYAEIRIRDEGEGFDEEELPHVFERFYHGKKHMSGGVGIGLPLAKAVFEMENGILTAGNLPEKGAFYEIRIYCH